MQATHDSADADGHIVGIADQQVVGRQRSFDIVERDHRFTVASETNAEASAAQSVEVIRVVWLIQFEHHVVADVDHVVDRPHACGGESASDPVRRRLHHDAADDQRRKTGAPVAIDQLDWCATRRAIGFIRLGTVGKLDS